MIDRPVADETRLAHAGNRPRDNHGVVNPPVYHASTILFPTLAALHAAEADRLTGTTYGRYGTPTVFALEEAFAALEGAERAIALPTGLAAVTMSLLAFLKPGDHLLMVDTVYEPARRFCDQFLAKFGIATTYYPPMIGAEIAKLMRPETRVVYLETPGSLTFEVQDAPAIAAAAHAAGALVLLDNTWGTPLFFKPLAHGVDVSIQAATKYISGHSDVMLGMVATRAELWRTIKITAHGLGHAAAPDDCYLALRGLRTLAVRLARHQANALALARWLQARPEVERVLHPALPEHPGHAVWRRDFTGSSGLFSVLLNPVSEAALAAMLDGLTLFAMGYSWGGYESLIVPGNPGRARSAAPWTAAGPLLRIHAGLEDPQDLIADLEAGFRRLKAAG
jgi:cysteine-S-conjugate beta-lyase